LNLKLLQKIVMSSLRYTCIQSNYKRYFKSETSGQAMFVLSEELIDLVNVHYCYKELMVDSIIECMSVAVNLIGEFKEFLINKIEDSQKDLNLLKPDEKPTASS